jgi:hypothetical protein
LGVEGLLEKKVRLAVQKLGSLQWGREVIVLVQTLGPAQVVVGGPIILSALMENPDALE